MKAVLQESPTHHPLRIKARLHQLIKHLRGDVGKVTESNAPAHFESPAEVSTGLGKAMKSLPGIL